MSTTEETVAILIMNRTYQIKCPPSDVVQLQKSAALVDAQMRKLNQSNQSISMERLLVVTALNIAHELSIHKDQKNTYIDTMQEQMKSLQNRIQKFLDAKEEVLM